MKKVFLLIAMFFFSGCSLDSLIALTQVDRVQMIKKNASMKHYRAYFTRTDLKPIRNGKRYLFFYNKRSKDLAILLRKKGSYTLYSIFHAHRVVSRMRTTRKTRYSHVAKLLRKKGYRLISPSSVGSTVSVSRRRYKGIKTLRVDVKDYRLLQNRYKKALRTYNTRYIQGTRTSLPKHLITSDYRRAKAKTKTAKQQKAFTFIGQKLHFIKSTKPIVVKEVPKTVEEAVKETPKPVVVVEDFSFYLHKASHSKLNHYLKGSHAKDELTYSQYKRLMQRNATLKEQDLLRHGSLEVLIQAYKQNKKPIFKRRIMVLMKEAQKKK